jgi:hypothetical protein
MASTVADVDADPAGVGDAAEKTIGLVVGGDVSYNQCHMMVAASAGESHELGRQPPGVADVRPGLTLRGTS